MNIRLKLPNNSISEKSEDSLDSNLNLKRNYSKNNFEKVQRWSEDECKKYEEFIVKNFEILNGNQSNRTTKLFLLMSDYIGTRAPIQCRSHHQKFYKRVVKRFYPEINFPEGRKSKVRPRTSYSSYHKRKESRDENLIFPNIQISGECTTKGDSSEENEKFHEEKVNYQVMKVPSKKAELKLVTRTESNCIDVDWKNVFEIATRKNSLVSDMLNDADMPQVI